LDFEGSGDALEREGERRLLLSGDVGIDQSAVRYKSGNVQI